MSLYHYGKDSHRQWFVKRHIGLNQFRGTLALTTIKSDRFISALGVPIIKSYPIYNVFIDQIW